MGLFLDVALLNGCNKDTAEQALKSWCAAKPKSRIVPSDCQLEEQSKGTVIIFNDDDCFEAQEFCITFSKEHGMVAMHLYIYDGDFWGYYLYKNGEEIDCFSPIPDYFEDIDEQEWERQKGNSNILAKEYSICSKDIERYLVTWDEDDNGEDKAYPDDEYGHIDWQMVDFMKKLGYHYFLE